MVRCRIVPYEGKHVPEVIAFNRRLQAGGGSFRGLPEQPESPWLPKGEGKGLFCELFVAVDEDGVIRGGYSLKHQEFQLSGRLIDVGFCRYPVSEGVVNPQYSMVGALLFRDAIQRQPLLYALGIGGLNEPYGKALRAMHWKLYPVPFFFMILRTKTFLRNMEFLRTSSPRRVILNLLAGSRILDPLVSGTHTGLGLLSMFDSPVECDTVTEFGTWADDVWRSASGCYSLAAVRDSITLNTEYPAQEPFHKLRFFRRGKTLGWAVLLATQMDSHKHFGSMHVGSIVDCMAVPGSEVGVIKGSRFYLKSLGVDLIVSNQNHHVWKRALIQTGFLLGPSNFYFGMSRGLEAELDPVRQHLPLAHLNRGDGSDPVHL